MRKLNQLLSELENNIPNLEKSNLAISKANVGWQIDHCLIVLSRITSALEKSNPEEFKPKFNFKRFMVFTTNTIPRGKAKAPEVVMPVGEITENSLREKLEKVKAKVLKMETFHKNSFFAHPYFNDLNVKQTQKFLILHTTHHIKIIRDIVKK
ncbi:hypothetical protein [Flavobacterium sp.]|uniref:hypothetical protein n=1 Tax=Flavobacterium sp. TaxID=239 RepID=UPI00375110E0